MDKAALLVAFLESKGLHLRETLNNQKLRCPFHGPDRTPSASVNLDKAVFHCFTCDVSGDALELIKIDRGVTFAEAVRIAEKEFGASGGSVPQSSGERPLLSRPRGRLAQGGGRFLPSSLREQG